MLTLEKPLAILLAMPLNIPPISDELLDELSNKIRPVVECDGRLFYIEPVDPRNVGFSWGPVTTLYKSAS